MVDPADMRGDARLTYGEYIGLVAEGRIQPSDRVELLEGVVVAMSPQNPPHAAAVCRTDAVLHRVLPNGSLIRVQSPLVLDDHSMPEPDLAVVPGSKADYDLAHPTTAWLVVEVADSSLVQDRITKTRIYAGAAISELWIVNLRDACIEVYRDPDPSARLYRSITRHPRGDIITPAHFPAAAVAVDDLLPQSR